MPKINLLPEELINKIAAGEVIERPASVVKELVENSLDAGANKITIEIQDSGKKLIKVSDNGEGMDKIDAKNAVLRHATSKIKHLEELFSIQTLGFRGEALASIASVSQFSIITKQQDKLEGFNLVLEGGKEISSGIAAAEQGTSIEVRNLFFNTPARMKFLKTDAVEMRHIIDVITHYALINPKVSLKLLHDNRELIHAPAVGDMKNNIAAIYGTTIAKDMLEVNFQNDDIIINGFITKPYNTRNDKNQQALFVNHRWVKNEDLTKAVYEGYHSLLFVGKHPIFVLDVEVNPNTIDVNVHPQKSEIKIEQKEKMCSYMQEAVKETLKKNNLIPVIDLEFTPQPLSKFTNQKETKQKYSFETAKQTTLSEDEKVVEKSEIVEKGVQEKQDINGDNSNNNNNKEDNSFQESVNKDNQQNKNVNNNFPEIKLFGQIHKTFFVAETQGGMFFIDQHAAHERVMYENFMEQFMDKNIAVQTLLQSELLECTVAEKVILENKLEELQQFGFQIEHFGENTFVIKTIPTIFGRKQGKELVSEIISALQENSSANSIDKIKEIIVTRMACRAAVMAGDELTTDWMNKILEELKQKELPFTCPHGRPTMIKITVDELEKKFKRK